ncbi:hypothetical protein FJZ31_41445 [Candidatus Poribacteria bacterium]|nr:hypothetical protein [Candidatus Poribacteria bacterium]
MKGKHFLPISLWLLLLSFVLSANAEVKYLGADWKTQGDWIGKYGKGGAIIFCNKEFHNTDLPVPYEPSEKDKLFKRGLIEEISITSSGNSKAYGWSFNANPGDDKRAPWLVDKSARYAACISGRAADVAMTLKVNSTHYKVTIYCVDYDTADTRGHRVYGYQGEKLPDKPDEETVKYREGVHYSWEVTGDEVFRYFAKNTLQFNTVSSGLFIDDMQDVKPAGKLSTTWGRIKNER